MRFSAFLEELEALPEDIRKAMIKGFSLLEETLGEMVTKRELRSLEESIKKLTEAQRKTEERVNQLAKAQRKTEERLNQLAEAQRKTEERLTRLEETVERLAEAQRRTEERLEKLIVEHTRRRKQLGGLTDAFGYVLEDRAIRSFPSLLPEYGFEVIGSLERRFFKRDGEEYELVGEAKSRLSKRAIDGFIKKCEKISKRCVKIIVSYIFTPEIEKYAKDKGVILIPSYKLRL